MGMFDSVYFPCLDCGGRVEVQSKAGDCSLREYEPADVPPNVAADIIGEGGECESCRRSWRVVGTVSLGIARYVSPDELED